MERITSRENKNIKRVIRLMKDKKERAESGQFVAEGMKLCGEVLAERIAIDELYCTAAALEKYPSLLALLSESAEATFEITREVAEKLADTATPQGCWAVCRLPEHVLDEQNLPAGRYIALEALQDPGNLGTILRTADAFGVGGVLLTDDCPDVFSPKVLRATMGSAMRVPVCVTADLPALLRRLSVTHGTYAATLGEGAVSIRECDLTGAVVVAVGNEGAGLSQEVTDACAHKLVIDMRGGTESLNAAVAASVILWEMTK